MIELNRKVRDISDTKKHGLNNETLPIEYFREHPAWVLLGEPGAGKTTVLKQEEKALEGDGQYISIATFLEADVTLYPWQGKTLFLDGLDEIQEDPSRLIEKIKTQLMRLTNPPFRLACRAANWYGSCIKKSLTELYPNLIVLELVSLSENEVLRLLQESHSIQNPENFITQTKKFGIHDLLRNPEMLNLMVQAVQGGKWPESREEVYQLACQRLVHEDNANHRQIHRKDTVGPQDILHAAGYLCSILLFSDKQGIALDESRIDNQFISIDSCVPEDEQAAAFAVERKLFISAGEERVTPSHRSVAEYLASDWLCKQIANKGLSINRLKQLILDADSHIKPALWGLCGWLAQHNPSMRGWIVAAGPLAALYYGDVEHWPVDDKIAVFDALIKIPSFPIPSALRSAFSALALPQLEKKFKAILTDHHQFTSAQRECVLVILNESDPVMPKFTAEVKLLIEQTDNLNVQLIDFAVVYLYPQDLSIEELLKYLDQVCAFGRRVYIYYLNEHIVDKTPKSQLPVLAENLIRFFDNPKHRQLEIYFQTLLSMLLLKIMHTCGLDMPIAQLLSSLKLGDFLNSRRQKVEQEINQWFSNHPERYYDLMDFILERSEQSIEIYRNMYSLRYITAPLGANIWYFEKAAVTNKPYLREYCLKKAVDLLHTAYLGNYVSIKQTLDEWALSYPDEKSWLQSQYDGILEQNQQPKQNDDDSALRVPGTIQTELMQQLSAIRDGNALPGVMGYLADIWQEVSDNKNTEIENHFERRFGADGLALYQAAKEGFKHCLDRKDLPTALEIIKSYNQGQLYRLNSPCLIGIRLIWQDTPDKVTTLSEDAVASVIAFYFCGHGSMPDWLNELAKNYLNAIVDVMISFAKRYKKLGLPESPINTGFYQLLTQTQIVQAAVLELLQVFPLRADKAQLVYYLNKLLQSAFNQPLADLKTVIQHKISLKGIDAAQKVYWYAAATLLSPLEYAPKLLKYVGQSSARILTLATFIEANLKYILTLYPLPENIIADFIELFTPHFEVFPEMVLSATYDNSLIQRFVTVLAQMPTEEAGTELLRLCHLESVEKIRPLLNQAYQAQQRHRQNMQLTVSAVAKILKQSIPANTRDLWALTLDKLDEIINDIEKSNTNDYQFYWDVLNYKTGERSPKHEDPCRNLLLNKLRAAFNAMPQISCEPEGDHRHHTRADIVVSYQNYQVPIETKGDFNKKLWARLREQLINQYATSTGADGYGIYVIFWFNDDQTKTKQPCPPPGDGGRKAQTPEELQSRLLEQLTPEEAQKIAIRVIDVSWPQKNL